MELKLIAGEFAVCRIKSTADVPFQDEFWFLAKTDEELSLVCRAESVPAEPVKCETGWRMLRVEGVLDFSLTGILARISGVLAEAGIPIFAVSTYNTDYILIKSAHLPSALDALCGAGYKINRGETQ